MELKKENQQLNTKFKNIIYTTVTNDDDSFISYDQSTGIIMLCGKEESYTRYRLNLRASINSEDENDYLYASLNGGPIVTSIITTNNIFSIFDVLIPKNTKAFLSIQSAATYLEINNSNLIIKRMSF